MKKKICSLMVLVFLSSQAYSMGYPGPTEPNRPEESDKIKIESTSYPFSMTIDKPSIHIATDPGSTTSGKIAIENNGLKPLKIIAYVSDWSYAADGSKIFKKAGTNPYSCANWIHIDPQEVLIEPLSEEEIKYVMTIPKDATGGHVAVIFFESVLEGKEGVSVGGRIGSIVYQETKGKSVRSGEIKAFSAEPGKGNKVQFKLRFKNTGNSHLSVNPMIEIYLKNSQKLEVLSLPSVKTMPLDEVTISEEYPVDEKGEYKAIVKVEIEGKNIERSADFSLPAK